MVLFCIRDPGLSCPPLAAPLLCGHWSFGSWDGCELPGISSPHSEKQAGEREKKRMKQSGCWFCPLEKDFQEVPGINFCLHSLARTESDGYSQLQGSLVMRIILAGYLDIPLPKSWGAVSKGEDNSNIRHEGGRTAPSLLAWHTGAFSWLPPYLHRCVFALFTWRLAPTK